MTENEDVKPFHAKEAASGQEAAEAVAAVLKHAQEREAAAQQKAPPKKQPRWLLPVGVNLGVFAAYLLIWSPPWVVINPIAPPPTEQETQNTRAAVFLYASKIEQFRNENGRLPRDLTEVRINVAGLDYSLQGSVDYILYTEVGEEPVTYNSAQESLAEWGAANASNLSARIGG
jgi:hypothetical protein